MGLKANLSLFKQCAGYAKACGKSHIAQTLPSKINIAGLKSCSVDTFTKVTPAHTPPTEALAQITSHFNNGGTIVFGDIAENYVTKNRIFIKGNTRIEKFGPKKGQLVTTPDRWLESSISLPHYHIDKLWTGGRGSGTKAVQGVVAESVANPKTAGRVTLDACCIDGKTSPAGFYYKLGFRFQEQESNKILAEWLKNGGKRENAPFLTGSMYLPQENIEHCLNYAH